MMWRRVVVCVAVALVPRGAPAQAGACRIDRYIAFEYSAQDVVRRELTPVFKINADGTFWADWGAVTRAMMLDMLAGDASDLAVMQALLDQPLNTLSGAEQDRKELAAGAALTALRCAKETY